MKQGFGKWIGLVILIAIIIGNLFRLTEANVSALEGAKPLETAVATHILQATIQITMIHAQSSEPTVTYRDASQETMIISTTRHIDKGIGTLLAYEGETLLVSHDHWLHLTSTVVPDVVQFHDSDGRFLVEMAGADFSQLILFHDGGTLILRAPTALAAEVQTTAVIGDIATLAPGDIVHVVHHQANQSDQVVLLAAEVLAIDSRYNIPLLSLRSLNGQSIEPGDSGGGVWLDGRFVGNLWLTVREVRQDWWRFYQPVQTSTARSYAAGLTQDLIALVQTLLSVKGVAPMPNGNPG